MQQEIQSALHETANYYAKNAYINEHIYDEINDYSGDEFDEILDQLDLCEILTSPICKKKFVQCLSKNQNHDSIIQGGISGISIHQNADYFEDHKIDLCAYYTYKIPVLFFKINSIPCIQRVVAATWSGNEVKARFQEYEEKQEDTTKDIVYVTESGTRYHTHRDCSHLNIKPYEIIYGNVPYERNKNNGKYVACELCAKGHTLQSSTILYITPDGNCYHTRRDCSGLKRTIQEMDLNLAKASMPCCKRCEKRDTAQKSEEGGS